MGINIPWCVPKEVGQIWVGIYVLESHLFTFGIEFMVCHMGAPLYFTVFQNQQLCMLLELNPQQVVVQGFHYSMMGIFAT